MNMITGRAWVYGDDVNTDVIFAGKYTYTITDSAEIALHALEDLDPGFARGVRPGDIIVAGHNWGCGSSREQAVTCLKANRVGAVVAASFGRIFYRNCINAALPAIVCPEAVSVAKAGESLEIDLMRGELRHAKGRFQFAPLPPTVMNIFTNGGLIEYVRRQLGAGQGRRPDCERSDLQ